MNKEFTAKVIDKANTMIFAVEYNEAARLCLKDAKELFRRGDYEYSVKRAEKAIFYAFGIVVKEEFLSNL